ncbi:hypothetical protein ACFULT_21145 [Rhodococcus sp. NPDC057297]|uniref:hypothetical protein n=1 Tax=Rhodococcus sp. NPDC057297 TaxID=3346090 RepID=UPI003627414A
MALGGEFGELAVAVASAFSSPGARVNLAALELVTSEIADVTLYLVRLFDVLEFPLPYGPDLERARRSPTEQSHPVFDSLANLAGTIGSILEFWQWTDSSSSTDAFAEVEVRLAAALRDLTSLADLVGLSWRASHVPSF